MTPSQPPIPHTTHTLPFGRLSPRDFERLCLGLVQREGYATHSEHGGQAARPGRAADRLASGVEQRPVRLDTTQGSAVHLADQAIK